MYTEHSSAEWNAISPQVVILKTGYLSILNYNYLVVDPVSRLAVAVDPAWQMEIMEDALSQTGSRLQGILITHAHPDHIHLAEPLAEKYACPIWMSTEEAAASGFRARQLVTIGASGWKIGQMFIEPILTPGHTPGSTCYLIGDHLFSGDVLFAEGCGMCPDLGAAHDMFRSLQNLKARLKPHTRICPGHSYGQPPGQLLSGVLRDNIYLQFSDQHAFAAFRLRPGQNKARMFNFV